MLHEAAVGLWFHTKLRAFTDLLHVYPNRTPAHHPEQGQPWLWTMMQSKQCGERENRVRTRVKARTPMVGQQNEEAVRQEYNRLAEQYDRRWAPYIDATLKAVLEAVECEGHERILDVPCGTGELEQRLLGRWPKLRITGADISPGMLEQAEAKDTEGRVTWIEADISHLPFADGEFDCVTCANSFHYFSAPEQSLQEMRRVLRPDGRLVLVDWCDDYLNCKVCSIWLQWTDPAFHRTYSLRSCQALATDAGFRVESTDRFRVGWLWGMMRLVLRRAG